MLRMPAASRTICIASAYWRRKAWMRGSVFCSANLFGPCWARRAVTSAALRPFATSTFWPARVSSTERACQAVVGAWLVPGCSAIDGPPCHGLRDRRAGRGFGERARDASARGPRRRDPSATDRGARRATPHHPDRGIGWPRAGERPAAARLRGGAAAATAARCGDGPSSNAVIRGGIVPAAGEHATPAEAPGQAAHLDVACGQAAAVIRRGIAPPSPGDRPRLSGGGGPSCRRASRRRRG